MPPKRKLPQDPSTDQKDDPDQKDNKLKRPKPDTLEKDAQEKEAEKGGDSDPDYSPSASSESESESDAATSSSSSDDDDGDSGIDQDSDQTGDDDDSDSENDDDASEDEDDQEDEKKDEKKAVGRITKDGRTLRPLPEDTLVDKDIMRLTDLASEIIMLDMAQVLRSYPTGSKIHRAAFIKGRVFLAEDRVKYNGNWIEIIGFQDMNILAHILLTGDSVKGLGMTFGNYLRISPPSTFKLGSETELVHGGPAHSGPGSTVKISHGCTLSKTHILNHATAVNAIKKKEAKVESLKVADKGRARPLLYPGAERRWNEGEQKKLLMFLRRVWPTSFRPAAVTIPMLPPAKKDDLAAPDDNHDDAKDIDMITSKYRSIWEMISKNNNMDGCQRWLANTFDMYRRFYITVTQIDWELVYREIAAITDIVATSLLPANV